MTWILGLSAYYHDSAAALIQDREIVAAASEERFTRKKHDDAFPVNAMQSCLDLAGIAIGDLDYVGFYEKPLLKFDRLLETYLTYAPRGYRSFAKAMPRWLQTKLHIPREIRRQLGGEYKLMGLAPYGQPIYADLICSDLINLKTDGSYCLNMRYFPYGRSLRMTDHRLEKLFGVQRRRAEEPIRQVDMDLAASIQCVTEEAVLNLVRHVLNETQSPNLCLAGGVALNCVANGRVLRESGVERLWIQPAAGDAGGALGVALWIAHQVLNKPRNIQTPDGQKGSLLGPSIEDETELRELIQCGAKMRSFDNEEELASCIAELLANGQVVGVTQGRMEFGPRALGSRSILGDPRDEDMQTKMNLKIKYRESFRPFAPSVLAEKASDCFEIPDKADSPYMLLVFDVKEDRRVSHRDDELVNDTHDSSKSSVPSSRKQVAPL